MDLEIFDHAGVRTLRLNRPKVRNAFNGALLRELGAAVAAAEAAESVRVVVLAGAGGAFCAGADLGWMMAAALEGEAANDRNARAMAGVFHALSASRKPTVARVQGAAMGGGVGLAAACDLVVAGPDAFFALSEVRLGLVPGVISPFVVRRLGAARARAAFLRGGRLDAAEAHRQGLVDELAADADALDARVAAVCAELARGGPEALAACKALVDGVAGRDPAEVLDFTAAAIAARRASPEAQEGMAAFLAKRPAAWVPGEEA
jgi:methylglutaconyl-CoA hydratase